MKILIADDNEDARHNLSLVLKKEGYWVETAQNGADALEKVRGAAPDLIISDTLMPEMDGFLLCSILKQDPATCHIPFVFYTATCTDEPDKRLALEMGADAFVCKPQDPEQLIRQIHKVLAKSATSRPKPYLENIQTLKRYNQTLVKQLEKKIQALEKAKADEKFRHDEHQILFNSAAEGLMIIDNHFNIVRMNDTYTTIFGVTRQEVLGKKCYDFSRCPRCHTADCSLTKAIKLQTRFEMNIERKNKEGTSVPCLLTVIPHRDRDGRILGIVESYRDMSVIRQTEVQLKLIKELIDQSNDAVFVIDFDTGIIRYANERACTNLGYSMEELLEMKSTQIQTRFSDMEGMEQLYRRIEQKGRMIFENYHVRKDGTSFPVEVSARYSLHGKDKFITAIVRDITERKQSEQAHLRLATAINQTDESVLITDSQPVIEYANPAFERITGYRLDEVVGQNPSFLKSGTHGPFFYDAMWDRLSSGKVWKGRLVNKKKDGTLFHEEASISPVMNDEGKIIHFVAVKRDVTHELESARQLQQAQKMEALGTLAGGVAHDFNNILSAVLGYTELALGDVEKGSAVEDSLKEVFKAGIRAKELVKQILTFTRQTDVETRPVQVNIIVKEVLKLLRASIPATIEIQHNIVSDALVLSNPVHIHQILMNLCTNAAQAMAEKGGILNVGLEDLHLDRHFTQSYETLKPGLYLKLRVSDTGTGIPSDIIGYIFDPYFTTKAPGEGTGMGLAMVHGIVAGCRGDIMVQSHPGRGSVFTVFLPVFKKKEASQQNSAAILPGGCERILFVDDEPPIVKMGSRMLENLGYKVTSETSSLDALARFRSRPDDFDLVITDMTMPKMTGEDLAAEIIKIRPDMPVILCTGYSKKITDDRMAKAGIKKIASKPILQSNLAKAVRRILDDAKKELP